MNISSRTPEGDFNHCPICGHDLRLEPSQPAGDAPCPSCGSFLWFPESPDSSRLPLAAKAADARPNGELILEGSGDAIRLLRPRILIGRRKTCDIRLDYPNVSQVHCELTFFGGYWYLRDLNSTNGVKVNGQRVNRKLLHPGDSISIAKRTYQIQYTVPGG